MGEADPKQLEFYVTVEYYVNKKHATDNIEINNPFPKTQKPKPQTSPAPIKPPSKPATIPKAKGSPAESKPASKKEEKGIGEIVMEKGKELWDWWESKGTIKKEQKPTQQLADKKSAAKKESIELPKTNSVCECEQYNLIWGNKVSCKFRKKVVAIAKELWPNDFKNMANNLMAVFAWETGETFKPDVPNRAGSGATGLIQFMPDKVETYFGHKATMETVPNYFNSKDAKLHNLPRSKEFAQMKAEDQLDYVKKYFEDQKGKKLDFVDFYLQVLFPVSSGKPAHIVFGTEKYRDEIGLPTDSDSVKQKRIDKYAKNSGMDINKDGKLYKSEIALSVQPFITKGLPEIFRKGKKKEENNTDKKTISDAVVVTDAGHGIGTNGDAGASVTKDTEAIMALEVETETAKALSSMGLKNVRTRTSELNNVKENQVNYRTNVFKNNKGKVMVSHHLNSVGDTFLIMYHPDKLNILNNPKNTKSGYKPTSGGSSSEFLKNSLSLANYIKNEITKLGIKAALRPATVPHTNYSSLGILRGIDSSDNAGVLIEMGSVQKINTDFLRNNSTSIGVAIANGIAKYLEVKPNEDAENYEECESESTIKHIESNPSSDSKSKCPKDCSQCFDYADVWGNPEISSDNGGKNNNRYGYNSTRGHKGIDILSGPAYKDVHSIMCGEVVSLVTSFKTNEYRKSSLGNTLMIKSKTKEGETVFILYCHLDKIYVKKGDKVKHGQKVALSGSTGNASYSGLPNGIKGYGIDKEYWHCHIEAATKGEGYNNFYNLGSYRIKAENYMKTKFDKDGNSIK